MQHFEYITRSWCEIPSDETAFLNAMGADGWELAGMRGDTFYFVRELAPRP